MNDTLRNIDFDHLPVATQVGRLIGVSGILLQATGYPFETGANARIETASGEWIDARVVGFRDDVTQLMPFRAPAGLFAGARVMPAGAGRQLTIGAAWRGRIVDGMGAVSYTHL